MVLSERFEFRLDQDTLAAVDAWREKAGGKSSRSEAIRRLVDIGLSAERSAPFHLSDGDRLSLFLLCGLADHLKVRDLDTDFIRQAILGGHGWAFKWQMPGLFHGTDYSEDFVREVADILQMWSSLEHGWKGLSPAGRDKVAGAVDLYGKELKFRGFDGNNEAEFYSVARFLIDDMERFVEFKKRDLNSHMPLIAGYRRMVVAFKRIWPSQVGAKMTAEQIIDVVKARAFTE